MDVHTKEKLKLAQRFKKEKKYEESKEIYDKFFNENPEILSTWDKKTYAWDIYYLTFQNPEDEDELFKDIELLSEIADQEDQSKNSKYPCPYTLSILKAMEFMNRNNQFDDLLLLADKLNPEYLSEKPSEFNGRKYPSNKEKYYSHFTKALIKSDYINEALEASKVALKIPTLTDSTWFKWRIAKCYKEIGEYEKSLNCLEELSKQKEEWYIYAEIADNYYFKQDYDKSLEYALKAALAPGQVESKVKLYSLMGELLEDEYPEESLKHYYLEYSTRLYNEWGISETLEGKIDNAGLDMENNQYWKIEKELKKFWNELKFKNQQPEYGIISNILPHGKAAFIKSENGNSYYFKKFQFKGDYSDFKVGTSVTFYLEEGYDRAKDEFKMNAVNIHPIN